ncbi:uro-adherence factor A [Drosophila tropicalis]|uniref:uro-adherence factor A n=1 Tax=Drosophila tropicalis TaxID=46794 RepID=UPI0035AB9929
MSCLCQYFNTTTETSRKMLIYPLTTSDDTQDKPDADSEESKVVKIVDASDMARTCAENWLLKKKLLENEVAIQSLEQLITTIVNKQHEILAEMYRLRAENTELKTECHQQREYHTMERNALIKELYDIQTFYSQKIQLAFDQKKQQEQCAKDEESDNDSESNEESSIASSDDASETESIASTASTSPCSTDSEDESSEADDESSLTESESD